MEILDNPLERGSEFGRGGNSIQSATQFHTANPTGPIRSCITRHAPRDDDEHRVDLFAVKGKVAPQFRQS